MCDRDGLGSSDRPVIKGAERAGFPALAPPRSLCPEAPQLPEDPPGHREAEGGQGTGIVQDGRAQLADPDGGQSVVAGQAVQAVRAPQPAVVVTGAGRAYSLAASAPASDWAGRRSEAAGSYRVALRLTTNEVERSFLLRRLDEVEGAARPN